MKLKKIALLAFLALGLMHCKNEKSVKEGVSKEEIIFVSVKDFKNLIEEGKGTLIDVRSPKEIANGYIEGAAFLNYFDDDFEEKLKGQSKLKPLYLYCRSGARSKKAAKLFLKNGYHNVHSLVGGFKAWEAAGLIIKK